MLEALTLLLFCAALVACLALGADVLAALAAGLVLFVAYALKKRFSPRAVFVMCAEGVWEARHVLLAFFLIGALTALWRAAGTIPVLVCCAGNLIRPSVFLPMVFLLNCLVSVLTGTSFGTAATMGVVCAAMGRAMGVAPALTGGAVLAGAFFGDRCSPVSTSALLVAELTGTDIYDNLRAMVKTAAVPFVLSCLLYAALGGAVPRQTAAPDLTALFAREFCLHWAALLPAVLILALSAFRVPVMQAMLASIAAAVPVCLLLQGQTAGQIARYALLGYQASDPELAGMIDGGGVRSMLRVGVIVCLSSAYAGIFRQTGLLHGVQEKLAAAAKVITPYGALLLTAVLTGAVACNQTLSIMLTNQLCEELEPNRARRAIDLENTAVVTAALIPWSIAGAVPLASIGAPAVSAFFACFLWLLPLWGLVLALRRRGRAS